MNILFTCAGRRTYLLKYFKENLSESDKIVATDMQLSAPALQVADVKLQVPAVYDPEYIDITLRICKEQKIDALFSLNDLELPILADNKAKFEAMGVKVVVSDPQVIDIAFDKYKTAQWVESLGLTAPKTYVRLEDVKKALAAGEVSFPLFMKPRWGSGSIGLESIADMEELDIYYGLLMKKIKKTILATASVGDEYIMIQEKLTGSEFGLDVMNDLEGNNVGVSVKQKLAMRSGETDKSITVDLPEVREIGRKIGFAFQIKDDLLDLDKDAVAGKTYGNDLKEGKLTLPALYYLQHCGQEEKKAFFEDLNRISELHAEGAEDVSLLEAMTGRILASGGVAYARQKAREYTSQALDLYRGLDRFNEGFEQLILEIGENPA